jgi:hypothetical protein
MAPAAGQLDNFIDHPPAGKREQALGLYHQGLDYVRGKGPEPDLPEWADELLEPSIRLMHNTVLSVPTERRERMLDAAERIGEISAHKAACTSMWRYVSLLREESRLSGDLVTEAASDSVYSQQGYPKFARFFRRTMVAGAFLDSGADLPRDNKDELAGVRPTATNRVLVAANAIPSGSLVVASALPRFRAVKATSVALRGFKTQGTTT